MYKFLVRIVKHAGKVIVSDKDITDAVFMFLKHRDNDKKLFVRNVFQKYKNIEAVRVRNEVMYLDIMKQKCMNNEPFMFGCDSKGVVTTYYNMCRAEVDDETKKKFILITKDTNFNLVDANIQFKDKFVFFSPKITYGVDFNNIDCAQGVFIHIKGGSITPFMAYQQTTGCRNIKALYYYSETESRKAVYENVESAKHDYQQAIATNQKITDICATIDKDDNEGLVENMFFDLFCYNEYMLDVYGTNKRMHFEQILKDEGFVLSSVGVPQVIDKETKKAANAITEQYNEELFEEYVESENKMDSKYLNLHKNAEAVGLTYADKETLEEYKELIIDSYKVEEYFKTIAMMRNDEYVNNKMKDRYNKSFDCNTIHSTYNEIKLVRHIEKKYNITPFDLNNKDIETHVYHNHNHHIYCI